jgi:hypothetical protein
MTATADFDYTLWARTIARPASVIVNAIYRMANGSYATVATATV